MPKKSAGALEIAAPMYLTSIERTNPQWVSAASRHFDRLIAIADEFDSEDAKAASDPDLSGSGRRKQREKVARQALQKLVTFEEDKIQGVRSHAAHVEGQITGRAAIKRPTDPAERLAYELRMQEIRAELRQLDQIQRGLVYLGASDPEVIDAIESAPPTLTRAAEGASPRLQPFIDPEQRASAALERARASDPEKAEELEALQALAQTYEIAVGTVRSAILDSVPLRLSTGGTVKVSDGSGNVTSEIPAS